MSFSEEELNESFRRGMFAGEGKAMRGKVSAPSAPQPRKSSSPGVPFMASFTTLNASLIVVVGMVVLSQGWPSRLRAWVQQKVQ